MSVYQEPVNARRSAEDADSAAGGATVATMNEPPETVFDKEFALGRVGGDIDLLKELAELFVEDYPNGIASLHTAIEEGDAASLERHAHNLKGAASNFAAPAVLKSASALEAKGRAKQTEGADVELTNLEDALAQLRVAFGSLNEE